MQQLQEHGGDALVNAAVEPCKKRFLTFMCVCFLAVVAVDDGRKLSGKESGSTYYLVAAENILSSDVSLSTLTIPATVSFADVKSACPLNAVSPSDASCTAYRTAVSQYSDQVNDFNSICPILFINYLSAVGPYPAGYFVGNCVSGNSGLCSRS
ncbi:unnamed protein product [Sphagnum troendelagicum]|uniref:GPI-anchored protein LLG1-like domain-containing protein n=1 Tax=Sphagnum troendelagicum TaxID=128251 RepID=A0ABP0TDD7_9BRYO